MFFTQTKKNPHTFTLSEVEHIKDNERFHQKQDPNPHHKTSNVQNSPNISADKTPNQKLKSSQPKLKKCRETKKGEDLNQFTMKSETDEY